jgi:hypothetical protein
VGAAAGAGGAIEVEGGYGGLRGWSVPAWGGWWWIGLARRRRLARTGGNTEALSTGTGILFIDQA